MTAHGARRPRIRCSPLDVQLTAGDFRLAVDESMTSRAVAIVGPSGAGKTTLLEVIAGIRRADRGRVAVGDHVLFDDARVWTCRRDGGGSVTCHRISRCFRISTCGATCSTEPADRLAPRTDASPSNGLTFARVVDVLDIAALLDRHIDRLSGGERQRVALARALLSAPDLLLLDEPLAALHTSLRDRILGDLQRVRDELAMPLVYVSHDAGEVRAIADWVLMLEAGRVVASGTPAQVLK